MMREKENEGRTEKKRKHMHTQSVGVRLRRIIPTGAKEMVAVITTQASG
jgi:hypothetical protein